jgi:hypothetical protein
MMGLRLFFSALVLLALMLSASQAKSLRDPTQPPLPPPVRLASPGQTDRGITPSPQLVPNGISLVVRQGKIHLVLGNRLYSIGEKLGAARIEHISETEVWWREAGVLHKQQIFPGIMRRVSESIPARGACRNRQPSPVVAGASEATSIPNTPDDFCHKVQP